MQMLPTVSGVANYFGKSNYGTHHLDKECKQQGVAQGVTTSTDSVFTDLISNSR